MADAPAQEGSYELVCPHCGKSFEAELLTGGSDRHAGFKCPHCRLFVAFERAGVDDEEQEAT
jgi:DNA-directed RNA polymerase subunit RPC12/RpoP